MTGWRGPPWPGYNPPMSTAVARSESPWTPLRRPLFRDLWLASVVSNVGTWMQNVGGVWLMTSLTSSPFLAALMQAAASLPFFLVGLLAGALADVLDRRKLLLFTQWWMAAAAIALGALTVMGLVTPGSLLWLTFALGLGAALNAPAWQALVPEVAGRDELPKAVALSGVGYNIARVVGPGIGGVVVAAMGAAANFFLNGASFLAVIWVIFRWDRKPPEKALPDEHLIGAMRAGLRYARHEPILQSILIRAGIFIFSASALWALLPVVARQDLGLGSAGYGLLLGCLGGGSLIGAMLLPRLSRAVSLDRRLTIAGACFALSTLALAFVHDVGILCLMLVVAGFGWLTTMVGVNVATQSVSPQWVQARALALYVFVTQGGLAAGSFFWGAVASHFGDTAALAGAGAGLLASLAAVWRWPLSRVPHIDVTQVSEWREPMVEGFDPDEGPVLVTVEYRIEPSRADEFKDAMRPLCSIRRRDGAIRWELYHDIEVPGRYLETFVVESWAEHVRQHARVVRGDLAVRRRVREFHLGEKAPAVSHMIYAGA